MPFLRTLYLFRKSLCIILAPLLLSPLLILSPIDDQFEASACAFSILLMAIYWVTEVVPLAVTALLPLVLYPLFGIMRGKAISLLYLKDVNVLFLGGLTVAVAVEHWNLHKRIALKVLTLVGAKPRWLLFGFMVTTAFLSMWISNVATTAMMIPIAQAVLEEISTGSSGVEEEGDSGCNTPEEHDHYVISAEYTSENSALGAEIGNIGDAKKLGKRLASYDEVEIPKWAFPNTKKRHRSGGRDTRYEKIQMSAMEEESDNVVATAPEEGPVASTDLLMDAAPKLRKLSSNLSTSAKEQGNTNLGMCKALTICICYAANIGGTATLTGTGPNLIMAGAYAKKFDDAPQVDFGSWVVFAFPGMVLFLMLAWIWLQFLFLDTGVRDLFRCRMNEGKTTEEKIAERVIRRQYENLGRMSYAEKSVLALFIVLVLLWLTRSPGFITGWGDLPIFKEKYVTDATIAILISFLLFVLPSEKPHIFCWRVQGSNEDGPVPPLLTWPVVQQKMAWNVILLLGGGFAMAAGADESKLSTWMGAKLEPLNGMAPAATLFICCFIICALTQCTSNTATCTIFSPILAELALTLKVHPLYFLLPATVTTSYAFMLPVSTPPNAIAYSYGYLTMKDMMKAGFLLNIVGVFIVVFSVYSFGGVAFDVFTDCPEWIQSEACSIARNVTLNTSTPLNISSLL